MKLTEPTPQRGSWNSRTNRRLRRENRKVRLELPQDEKLIVSWPALIGAAIYAALAWALGFWMVLR